MGKASTKYVPLDFRQPDPSVTNGTSSNVAAKSNPQVTAQTSIPVTRTTSSSSQRATALRSPQVTFDPYARVYVPQALKCVNTLQGQVLHTPPLRQIDYTTYINGHVGLDFLPAIPAPSIISIPRNFCLDDESAHVLYESYFRQHIDAEMDAQSRENEEYSLYEHDVTVKILPSGDVECSLVVPGLRENSPYVEEGDIVEMRQFVYRSPSDARVFYSRPGKPIDPAGYFQFFPPEMFSNEGEWTGRIFQARVSNIFRKAELLTLKIDRTGRQFLVDDPTNASDSKTHCKFNVQFPITKERYLGMQHILPVVHDVIRGISQRSVPNFKTVLQAPTMNLPEKDALQRRAWFRSMLYPSTEDCLLQSKLNSGTFQRTYFDDELNREQQKAVESACVQDYGTIPYLISGPPGTGKTKTLVEIALQLITNVENVCHILFCAPSDPAADTLVQRLGIFCKPGELLRLNRVSRTFAEVPGAVLPFCSIGGTNFILPPFIQLMKYKIVVTTTRDASMLMYARLTNVDLYAAQYGILHAIHPLQPPPASATMHWTALLVDEAAQAIEPEILIPLSVIAPPADITNLTFTPLFVMAGDQYQLGPRLALIDSPLKTSLFARLFARPVYSEHPLSRGKSGKSPPALDRTMLPILRPPFSNLIANYRSHPAILAVPSNLFYNDTLEHHATDINRISSWEGWNGKKWPVLFYNSSDEAEDELEMDGGGWYNRGEAQIACRIAQSLMATGLLKQEEICIMSPFKAQVNCLRNLIRQERYGSLHGVDIGPTEVFQGLERGVVLLCTTRTKERFIRRDQEQGWGIIGTPNKLNVALTRAKFGLIAIGKKDALESDENWRAFMSFCARNDLWDGKPYDWMKGGDLNRLEKVLLAAEKEEVGKRRTKALKVWDRGQSAMGDEAMWIHGVQAEADDMGSSVDGYSEKNDLRQGGEEQDDSHSSLEHVRGEEGLFEEEDEEENSDLVGLDMTGLREHL